MRCSSFFSRFKNELPDTHAKFHVLFLFFVAAMFFISILSLFSYHCWLVGKNRSTIETFRAPTFRNGPDKNGFSLGCSKNLREVFGDEKKYWLLPIFTSLGDGCNFPTRLVIMDPEQVTVSSQNEPAKSSGANQPFPPTRPLSESQNRLLASDSQWVESGPEDENVKSGTKKHIIVSLESWSQLITNQPSQWETGFCNAFCAWMLLNFVWKKLISKKWNMSILWGDKKTKFLHSPMDSCKHYLQSREVQTDALRFFMCIYAALNYILLPKGQILKCPAWMHKVQSGNYAFLLCCSGRE